MSDTEFDALVNEVLAGFASGWREDYSARSAAESVAKAVLKSKLLASARAAAWTEGFDRGFYAREAFPDVYQSRDASEPDIENPYEATS